MTSQPTSFVVDTSALTTLYRHSYPRRIFSSLWSAVDALAADERLITPSQVINELRVGNDGRSSQPDAINQEEELLAWARGNLLIAQQIDQETFEAIEVRGLDLARTHRGWLEDSRIADPYVIATAETMRIPVLSSETRSHQRNALHNHWQNDGIYPRGTKIPSVCEMLDVSHFNLIELFESEGWEF